VIRRSILWMMVWWLAALFVAAGQSAVVHATKEM